MTGTGFLRLGAFELSSHALLGLVTSFYVVLVHTISMFHLIGSGKELKGVSAELQEHGEVVAILAAFKKKCFPLSTIAIVCTVFAVLTGGGAHTKLWMTSLHPLSAIAAVIVNLYAFVIEYRVVRLNWALNFIVDLKKEGINVEEYLASRVK